MRVSLLIAAGLWQLCSHGPFAHAAERITLRNGFEMRCDHHADIEGRTGFT